MELSTDCTVADAPNDISPDILSITDIGCPATIPVVSAILISVVPPAVASPVYLPTSAFNVMLPVPTLEF